MRRRRFLFSSAVIALAGPWPSRAAQPKRVGLCWVSSASSQRHVALLREALRAKGFAEPHDVTIDMASMVERYESLDAAVRHLLERHPDVIVTYGGTSAEAVSRASRTVPTIMLIGTDPVKLGLARSFAHPGGNMTGAWLVSTVSGGKRLELLQRVVPAAKRVAYFYNDQSTVEASLVATMAESARALGFALEPRPVALPTDIPSAVASAARSGVPAFYVASSTMFTANARAFVAAVDKARLPAMYANAEFTDAGGLMSYGSDIAGVFRLAGEYVARILHGANPADTPIEQYSKFELVVNLRTAKAQAIDIPPSVIGLADRVIAA